MGGYGSESPMDTGESLAPNPGGNGAGSLIDTKVKTVSYNTVASQIYSASATVSADAPSGEIPKQINITNTGDTPAMVLTGYETYSDESTDSGATKYLQAMVMPGETYSPPVRAVISTEVAQTQFDGTANAVQAPSSINSALLWKDITADLGADVDATTDPITVTTAADHTNFFRVGDLIQIGRGTSQTDLEEANHYREILRVQSITNTTTMVCERALYGTTAGDNDSTNWNQGHTSGFPIFLPFFNAYHEVDKFSVAQTDTNGRFKCYNMFGYGRASSGRQGIVPGSFSMKFYQPGYQNCGMSGLTPSTHSGLAASTAYKIDITVDGGTKFQDLTFTTDTSVLTFGGSKGIIQKIQEALDTQYYTAGNLFEKKVNVALVDGDLRFTSGSHLSTSAILLEDTGDSLSLFDASAVGRFTAATSLPAAVAAKLPDDVVYDRVTYATSPNNIFCYDDGSGNIKGVCQGTINYETGAIDITGAPANAEFVFNVFYSSAFSGKVITGDNAMVEILANTVNQKRNTKLKVDIYG